MKAVERKQWWKAVGGCCAEAAACGAEIPLGLL